jgi:hypothetical protein
VKRRILFGLAALSMAFTLSADEPIIRDYGVVEVDTHVYMTNGAFVFERDGFYEGVIEGAALSIRRVCSDYGVR